MINGAKEIRKKSYGNQQRKIKKCYNESMIFLQVLFLQPAHYLGSCIYYLQRLGGEVDV